jgi:hypothetical protein
VFALVFRAGASAATVLKPLLIEMIHGLLIVGAYCTLCAGDA